MGDLQHEEKLVVSRIRPCVATNPGGPVTEVCGTCEQCRQRARLKVADWVITLHTTRRRHGKAIGSKSPEQRRYVKNLTLDMLETLGLVEPRTEEREAAVRHWARWMRGRQG